MVTLLIIGAVHSLYLSILVIAKKNKVTPDYLLAAFLFVIFISFGILYSAFENNQPEKMLYLIDISLLLAPLFFLYIKTITDPKYKFRWIYLTHFTLFICSSIYFDILFNNSPENYIDSILDSQKSIFTKPFLYIAFYIIELIIIPFYLIWSFLLLKKHKKLIANNYSYYKAVDYNWLKIFILIFGLVWLFTNGLLFINEKISFLEERMGVLVGFSVSTILIFCLGFLGFKQDAIFRSIGKKKQSQETEENKDIEYSNSPIPLLEEKKYAKTGLTKEKALELKTDVLEYMSTQKPYLNNKLTLKNLAEMLEIQPHHLSQIINEQFNCNFYDFINKYRVEEFKSKIKNSAHKQYNLISIAFDCGFNSKSSFNRIFKKFTNSTPSDFISFVES